MSTTIGAEYLGRQFQPNFGPVFSAVAYWLVLDENFLQTFEAAGIDPKDFPSGELPEQVVTEYLKLRESNGHKYAQWKLMTAAELLEPQILRDFEREDADFVRGAFFESAEKYRAEKLQREIAKRPEAARLLIEEFQTTAPRAPTRGRPLAQYLHEWAEEYDRTGGKSDQAVVLPRFEQLSHMIGGFNPGRLTILLADTGFGKTNFGIQLAQSAAEMAPALYINMEMIPSDFARRVLVSRSSKSNPRSLDAKAHAASDVAEKLFITPGVDFSIPEIRAVIQSHVEQDRVQLVVVDYDQKLKLHLQRGEQEWQGLQKALVAVESIAKKHRLQIVVLAQTSEDGKISGSRRSLFPASAVLRFYRHEAFGPVVEAVKNRFGARGAALRVHYNPALCQIAEGQPLELTKSIKEVLRHGS